MKNQMIPLSFEVMLESLLKEYQETKCFFEVPVQSFRSREAMIGVAAGPHTQLAGNLVAAFAAGAQVFELKTVQVLSGEALGIIKPCILISSEVYNREWSSELSMEEAAAEYIKAYLLIRTLSCECELEEDAVLHFIMSVGYDYNGIMSERMNRFFASMRHAKNTPEWIKDMECLKQYLGKFKNVNEDFLDNLSDEISNTVTLSTMHGCPPDEIEAIVRELMVVKELNVDLKLNPSLLGEKRLREIFDDLGYENLCLDEEALKRDLGFDVACGVIRRLMIQATSSQRDFGVKLTNTLPVKRGTQTWYLSGRSLYPLTLSLCRKLAEVFPEELRFSFSGGMSDENIQGLIDADFYRITLCSYLLEPKGYRNLIEVIRQSSREQKVGKSRGEILRVMEEIALSSETYRYRERKKPSKKEGYSPFCSRCSHCVDICPNRANRSVYLQGKKVVVHLATLCNECGLCSCFCLMGRNPYIDKYSVQDTNAFLLGNNYEIEEVVYHGNSIFPKP